MLTFRTVKKTYSKPQQEWEGFHPVEYSLDNFWDLPLSQVRETDSGRQSCDTTIGKALTLLAEEGIESAETGISTTVKTTHGDEFEFNGKSFHREIAAALIGLQKDGVNIHQTRWFYFDSDYCREEPMVKYSFFVVDPEHDKIVREDIGFHDDSDSAFDPKVFTSFDSKDWPWANVPEWQAAWVRYWYRRFYAETRIGQLVVLRPDEPVLYHFDRAHTGSTIQGSQYVLLAKTYRLLLVLVALVAALAFPSYAAFPAIAAIALFLDFLFVCWQTRKVGSQ